MTGRTVKLVGRAGLFGARHALALVLTIVVACGLWTVTYIALLLWSVLAEEGPGGPLAYPGGLVFVAVAGALAWAFLLFPSTALGEVIAKRCNLPLLASLPIAVSFSAALSLLLAFVLLRLWDRPVSSGTIASHAVAIFGTTFLPLVFYWAVAAFPPVALSALRALRNAIRLPNASR
jgi:hypothetical protein